MLRTRTRVTCRYWTTRSPCIATKQADLVKDLGKVAQQIHNLLLIEALQRDCGQVWRGEGLRGLLLLLLLLLLLGGVVGGCGRHLRSLRYKLCTTSGRTRSLLPVTISVTPAPGVFPTYRTRGNEESHRQFFAALVLSPHMPPARQHVQHVQQPPPSSVSIGKKPMAYPPQQQQQQQQPPQPTQPQPKSARAAAKAPLVYHPQQQQQQQQAQQNLHHHPPATPVSASAGKQRQQPQAAPGKSKGDQNKIWSTSTTEERERIKEFWLGLSEEERRNLVKIEKDTVLRKMKEQQRHSCSCAVCGRKRSAPYPSYCLLAHLFSRFFSLSPFDLSLYRNAIEEELEVLYDAYYEELEQYANYQQRYVSSGGTIPPPPGPGPFPGSVELDKNGVVVSSASSPASARGKNRNRNQRQTQQVVPNGRKSLHQQPHLHTHPQPKESEFDDDDPEEEEYEEEEEYDEEEDEEDEDEDEDEVEDVGDIQPKGKPTPVMPRAGARRPAAARGRNRGSAKVNGSAKRDQLFGGGLAVTGWCLCSILPLSPPNPYLYSSLLLSQVPAIFSPLQMICSRMMVKSSSR